MLEGLIVQLTHSLEFVEAGSIFCSKPHDGSQVADFLSGSASRVGSGLHQG